MFWVSGIRWAGGVRGVVLLEERERGRKRKMTRYRERRAREMGMGVWGLSGSRVWGRRSRARVREDEERRREGVGGLLKCLN